jgi:hypothetical protein
LTSLVVGFKVTFSKTVPNLMALKISGYFSALRFTHLA